MENAADKIREKEEVWIVYVQSRNTTVYVALQTDLMQWLQEENRGEGWTIAKRYTIMD